MATTRFLATTLQPRRAENRLRTHRLLTGLAVATALLLLASCGSAGTVEGTNADTDEVQGVVAAELDPTEPAASNASEAESGAEEPADLDERVVTYPALGGLRMEIDADVLVSSEGDYVALRRPNSDGVVVVTRTSQTAGALQISTVDDFLAAVQDYSQPEITPVDETLDALDTTLTLHQFRGGEAPPGPGLFSSRPYDYGGNTAWHPGPLGDAYLGEITGGVLAIAAIAQTENGLADAHDLLAEVVPLLSLTTATGLVAELEEPGQIYETLGEAPAFEPATLDPDGAPELTTLFSPVEPGQYQMGNLSVPITVDFSPGWFVALNFPTFVVFAEFPPVGPGFRDIVFQQSANAIGGINNAQVANGAPILIEDINEYIDNPPAGLLISNIDRNATIGGMSAARFDVVTDATTSCQPGDPCDFMMTSPTLDFITMVNPGVVHRTWWVTDVPAGPLVITASAAEADTEWLDTRAQELIDTLVIASND